MSDLLVPENVGDVLARYRTVVVGVAVETVISFADAVSDMRKTASTVGGTDLAQLQPLALVAREAISELERLVFQIERESGAQQQTEAGGNEHLEAAGAAGSLE